MSPYITNGDIKPTSKGFRVDKKAKGQPRLRKTFETYEEAEIVLKKYLKGEGETLAASATRSVTWRDLYDNAVRRKWRKSKTVTQQENASRAIDWYLGWDNDVRAFDQATADTFQEFIEDKTNTMTTASRYFSAVRYMLKCGQEWDLITWKVPKLEHHAASAEGRINFFDYETEERITNLMYQICRPDHAELFQLLIETGMRTSEGQYLLWRDVDLDHRVLRIWGTDTKTGKSRRVPLTDKAHSILKSRKDNAIDARVFPEITHSQRRSTWESVRKALGNYDDDFVWYTTRHTCASRLMRAGVDIKTIQAWLGHSRIETTMRYIQFSNGSLMDAAASLNRARQVDTAVKKHDNVPAL